jgi:hypothetical protein
MCRKSLIGMIISAGIISPPVADASVLQNTVAAGYLAVIFSLQMK